MHTKAPHRSLRWGETGRCIGDVALGIEYASRYCLPPYQPIIIIIGYHRVASIRRRAKKKQKQSDIVKPSRLTIPPRENFPAFSKGGV